MPGPADPTRPRALRPGSRVALVAPAGGVDSARVEEALKRCRSLELDAVRRPPIPSAHPYLAGSDDERLGTLQEAFDDPEVDAVWALRGGYGTLRILDRLRLDRQGIRPIPFIGFSDNTTLHLRHWEIGVVSFHGPNASGPFPAETEGFFRRTLFSAEPPGPLPARDADPPARTLVGGRAEGRLIGGNLALLAALCGSSPALRAAGCVLFLEDVGEPAYRIDRMLVQLERAGALEGVAGLAFGRFTAGPDDTMRDDNSIVDLLGEVSERIGVPAVCGLPFGHVDHNCTLPLGVRALLDADAATLSVVESAVSE